MDSRNLAIINILTVVTPSPTAFNQTLQPTAGRSHDAVIRVYDKAGSLLETQEHKGDAKTSKRIERSPGKDTKPMIARPLQAGAPEISSAHITRDAKILHLKFVATDWKLV